MEEVKESVFDAQVRMFLEARKNERPDRELAERNFISSLFYLAERLVAVLNRAIPVSRDVTEELVTCAYEKADRCDPTRGKPFNFFTTVMIGHYQQFYRKAKNYKALKKMYNQHLLKGKKNA